MSGDWQEAIANLSEDVDAEFGRTSVDFRPMKKGAGPQSRPTPDSTRENVDDVCVIWSERHEDSDIFRNRPGGEKFRSTGTDVSKMNIYCSVDCRELAVVRQGDQFIRNGHTYEVVEQRPDGGMRTRYDLARIE